MVEKGIRDGICHAIYQYAIANNNALIIMIKTNNHHVLSIGT